MDIAEIENLRQLYRTAVDNWIAAIREEEELASSDHSMVQMERWDAAGFRQEEAAAKVKAAKEAYHDGLRQINYSF